MSMIIPQLETGRETLGVILNEKLDEILKETMQVTQKFENYPNNRKSAKDVLNTAKCDQMKDYSKQQDKF